ncbi:hypothetical protein B0H14DRAFT_3452926 [Mycena olivaceomarginata]|nr:hypothetical protein B0H14DRAFT_3452926 [Mycena olivaceomarginata]
MDSNQPPHPPESPLEPPQYKPAGITESTSAAATTPLPPTYTPSNGPQYRTLAFFPRAASQPASRRTLFSSGGTRSPAPIQVSPLYYNEILDDLRGRENPPRPQPPKYTAFDPFLDSQPNQTTPYDDFWTKLRPKAVSNEPPKSYSKFFEKPVSSASPFRTFSTPASNTTTFPSGAGTPASINPTSTPLFAPPSFGKFTSSDDFVTGFNPFTPDSPSKRKKVLDPDSPSKQDAKRQKVAYKSWTTAERLDKVFNALEGVGWTLVRRYLTGKNTRTVAELLESWMSHPDDAGYDQDELMLSTTTPYTELSHVRPALTSFAAQIATAFTPFLSMLFITVPLAFVGFAAALVVAVVFLAVVFVAVVFVAVAFVAAVPFVNVADALIFVAVAPIDTTILDDRNI